LQSSAVRRGPRPACPCEPRDAARSEVRKRMIAQTRFRFLRAAWKASRRSSSGAAMRSPRAAPPSWASRCCCGHGPPCLSQW